MDFITAQDFTSKVYNIPDAMIESPAGGTVENSQLTDFIQKTVDNILRELLGGSLYNAFLQGLDALPDDWVGTNSPGYSIDDEVFYNEHVWKSLQNTNLNHLPIEGAFWTLIPDNEWLLLKNGLRYYSYVVPNRFSATPKDRTWKGIKEMLIPYVFEQWLKADYDVYTKVGVVRRTAENATIIDPTNRLVSAHNIFAASVLGINGLLVYLLYSQSLGSYVGAYDTSIYVTFKDYLRKNVIMPSNENPFNI